MPLPGPTSTARAVAASVATAVAVLAACAAVADPVASAAPARSDLAVTGYQEQSAPPWRIDRSARSLTTVGVDGVNLMPSGASITALSAAGRGQAARAHADGLRAELLVGNFSGAIDDFSEPLAHRMLARPAHRVAVARKLAALVRAQGWDGVQVDLESLRARDATGLDAFLSALRAALPARRSLAICLQNTTSLAGYASEGYHLRRIARRVDRVTLMAYDQHGPWENTPGPIGALDWVRAGLRTLIRRVPRAEIDLGVAGYGYAWRPHENVQLGDATSRRLAGARAVWRPRVGEWSARLRDGSSIWWSDARSYRLRAGLAGRWHLHGLAVWSLGTSDPIRG